MSPRPYRLGQRQAATEQTRTRVINAARELLMSNDGYSHFSIDAVARDSLAASGGMEQLAPAFRQPEPLEALKQYIVVFSHFWDADRLVMRRLRALAALDPDFEHVIRARDEWRRQGVRMIMQRFVEKHMLSPTEPLDETVGVLFTLLSFETFDTLAGPMRSLDEVAPLVYRLGCAAIGLNEEQLSKSNRGHSPILANGGENEEKCFRAGLE